MPKLDEKCVSCDFVGQLTFFTESYPCRCGETVTVNYNMCAACGSFWRSCDGKVLDEVDIVTSTELRDLMLDVEDPDDVSMEDCITRCVVCNAPGYSTGPKAYKCTKCPTEWVIIGDE